jgi:adenylate cyclase
MFTDMVGFSALTQADEAAALQVLERHNRLLRPLFAQHRGREVKVVGDAFLVEFESALDATRCAVEIQRTLRDYNASAPADWRIRLRVGVHVGDVEESGGDVLGDTVNVAARIVPLAEPEGICLTQQVVDQVQNKIELPLLKLPSVELKNIRFPPAVYQLLWTASAAPRRTVPGEGPSGRHLAVLPLANISPDPADGYFADGLTEELITTLSQVGGLSVIARTSVTPYKTVPKSIAQVGAELNVDTVLEGSVRKAGNRMRISLQLIDVSTQRHIWANSYDRGVDDVFAVQSDIAERTAQALRLELRGRPSGRPDDRPTASSEAYDLYLLGLAAMEDHHRLGLGEAARCFEGATRLDPQFAEAFAAWGNLYVSAAGDHMPTREAMPRARSLAARAIELDPRSSDAHATLANIALQFDYAWAVAEAEFLRAIELNPSNATAYRFYGLLLTSQTRYDEAIEIFRRLSRLDPVGGARSSIVWVQLDAGRFEVALESLEDEHRREPTRVGPRIALGMAYLVAGRTQDALRVTDGPIDDDATDDERFDHALVRAALGRPEEARAVLAAWKGGNWPSYLSEAYAAMLYARLGEAQQALDLLERDSRTGDKILWLWHRSFAFDPIRDDPRFVALLKELGLPLGPPNRRPPAP